MTGSRRIGKYEILELIGRGGFAVVYQARDTELDRDVALKVLHPQHTVDPQFVQRFRREAQTAARLHHPHIVTVHEVGEEAGQHYIAMALLSGRTLDKLVDGKPLPVERAISVVEQVADALDAIHERGWVHRDVKPANVMVDEEDQATLLDFGIVRAAEGTRLTTKMTILGTPEYMAPEQAEVAEDAADIDWRADVYALGVVAYELLAGRPPFTARSPTAILHKHAYEPPPAPRTLNPDLPAAMEPVLLKALAKGREERFQRAGAFAAELRRAYVADSQAREREAQIGPLYGRLQTAAAAEDWGEVLTLGGRIHALDPAYRDVAGRVEQARRELRRPRRGPVPRWVWAAGGLVLAMVVIFASRWNRWFPPHPAETLTVAPSATPAASATSTAPAPSPTPVTPTKTPTAAPPSASALGPGATWVRPADGMVMVAVPAGEFEMGSDDADLEVAVQLCSQHRSDCDRSWFEDEQPAHTVALDGFWIDRTEVTVAQFAAFVDDTGHETDAERVGWGWVWTGAEWEHVDGADWQHPQGPGSSTQADHPVVQVSWDDAVAYCRWAGARLPTEAQWEYAARGEQGFIFPWGDEFACWRGNFDDETQYDSELVPGGEGCDGYETTAPAGSFPAGASWCGALDLAGNASEWVKDWYSSAYYGISPSQNPTGAEPTGYRLLRGGSWSDPPDFVRSALRLKMNPTDRYVGLGFRCARGEN